MTNIRRFLYKLAPFIVGDKIVDASYVEVDNENLPLLNDNAQGSLVSLQNQINNLIIPAPQSFRSFRVFSGGTLISNVNFRIERIIINSSNIAEWANVNNIYSAQRVDKNVEVLLPTPTDISTSGQSYPIVIEITHLGGSARLSNRNLIIPQLNVSDTSSIETIALGNARSTSILQGDVVVLTKTSSSSNWIESRATHVPGQTILPSGVFNLQVDRMIQNISNLSTELNNVLISAGDAFEVVVGGDYFGEQIRARDVIVSLIDNPNLTTESDDWLIISNGSGELTQDQIAFFNNVNRLGSRFELNRNISVDSSNVEQFISIANGTPLTLNYNTTFEESQATARVATFINQSIQFTDLQGGNLKLSISFNASSFSGSEPDLQTITFDYGGSNVFVFRIDGIDSVDGLGTFTITIPNNDYTSILNSNCTITLNYNFRGATFIGSFTIQALTNTSVGALHDSIENIASEQALLVEQRVQTKLNDLQGDFQSEQSSIADLVPRVSPYRTVSIRTPVETTYFQQSTGVDAFPNDLTGATQVSPQNPRFTVTGTDIFLILPAARNYFLNNTTQTTITSLVSTEPGVDLGASFTSSGTSYFVYRVSGLTANDVLEVDIVNVEQRVAWQDDINGLKGDVARIDAELSHAVLDLPDEVVSVLDNDIAVNEETNAVIDPTNYNRQLAGASNTTQTVFYETTPNTASLGSLESKPLSDSPTDRLRRKLIYVDPGAVFGGIPVLLSNNAGTLETLLTLDDGVFKAQVFVPAIPAGTTNVTVYPAPSNRLSGQGVWISIPALTFQNGVPVTEADEVFFTRNVPSANTPIAIQYRGHANGNVFGLSSTTLLANQNSLTFTLNSGSESATVEVLRINGNIRVSVTENVYNGLPVINDVEVILSYTEQRNVPAVAETTRSVVIEPVSEGGQVFAIKPSSTDTLILVGTTTEIDTNFPYFTLFGNSLNGTLRINTESATFLDYEDFEPITSTIQDLENHARLPQFGLFTTNYTHETVVSFDTQLRARDPNGNLITLGDITNYTIEDTSINQVYRITVTNGAIALVPIT